ncbi:MAG: acireductone synthase [Planctomycetota bacterium]
MPRVTAILTDIEGTTSSISFVKDVLFPYAATHLADYVNAHLADDAVQQQLAAARELADEPDADTARTIAILRQWIAEDRKATPLKALQGLIWDAGYRNGDYRAHIYEDAWRVMKGWHEERKLPLFVYSSGSILAQKLFFGFSERGDLTPWFHGWFDTTSGPKQSADSYRTILQSLPAPAGEVLFLSDIRAELDAAKAAGMQTTWLVRDDSQPLDSSVHRAVRTFDAIKLS